MRYILSILLIAALPSLANETKTESVISLSAQASMDVPQDHLTIILFYEQQARTPDGMAQTLKQKTSQALQEAKAYKSLSVRTGLFSITPIADQNGKFVRWNGRTELIIESDQFERAAQLAGKLGTWLQVGSVQFSLSSNAKQEAQEKLTLKAIANFQKQARAATQAFGFTQYQIREIHIDNGSTFSPVIRAYTAPSPMEAPVPILAGTTPVTVQISGSIRIRTLVGRSEQQYCD